MVTQKSRADEPQWHLHPEGGGRQLRALPQQPQRARVPARAHRQRRRDHRGGRAQRQRRDVEDQESRR